MNSCVSLPGAAHRAPRSTFAAAILCAGLLGAAGLLCSPGSSAAQEPPASDAPAEACPTAPVPKLSIVADFVPYSYDHSHAVTELGGIKQRSDTTSGHDVQRMLGLTRQAFEVSVNTAKAMTLVRPDGSACVGYTDGTIRLRISTEIFIARELPEDSCLYREVLNHEERHANVGRRLFGEFVTEVEAAVGKALADQPFVEVASQDNATLEALARLREIIAPHYRDFRSTYRKRQAIIDTSGEYARVREACPGEQERVLNEVMNNPG